MDTGEARDQRLDEVDRRDEPSLTARAASGLRWSSLGFAALMVANLAYTMTMSRLVDPVAFGLMALAQLVVLFAQFFVRMGLASALVQKPVLSRDDIRAASTAGIAIGVVCFAVVWVLAPLFGALFRAPDLPPVLRLLGVTFLFEGMAMVGIGLLRRELRFRELSVITVATYVLGYLVVGVGLALLGAGVWSLVVGALVSSGSQTIWQYALLRHPIRPVLRREPYREVCGYGMRLSGAHLLDYVGANLDTYTVGRFADTAVVGEYTRGYYLAFQPLRVYLAQALTNVLFPHLSRIQHDAARLRRAYLSVLALGGILVFPVCAGMAVAARELVLVVLGRQWSVAATAVPWFALAAGCSVISALSQTVAEARADLYRSLGVQAAYIVVLAGFLAVALGTGPMGSGCSLRRSPPRRSSATSATWVSCATSSGSRCPRCGRRTPRRRSRAWAWRSPSRWSAARSPPRCRTLVTFAAEVAAGRARARAVHPVLPASGDPPRAAHAADRGRGPRRRRQPAMAPGTARHRPAGSSIMIDLVLLGVALVAIGAVGIAVIELLVRRAEVGAALLLGATLMSATLVSRVPSLTLPGGIRVQLHDVGFTLVLAAAILRMLRMPRFTKWQRWALLVAVMLVLSLVRGVAAFGPQHAIAELRLFLAFVAGALYFSTFAPSRRMNDRIGRIWLVLSIPMMIVVCLRWLATLAGIDLGVPPAEFGADAALKVLNGPYAFFLADAVILTVPFWHLRDRRSRRLTWLGALLLVFVVLLDRRTVWLTVMVGLAVLMVRNRSLSRRVLAMVVGAVLLAGVGYVALAGGPRVREGPSPRRRSARARSTGASRDGTSWSTACRRVRW